MTLQPARKSDNRPQTKKVSAIVLVSAIVVGAVAIWLLMQSNMTPVPSQEIQKPEEIEQAIKEVPKPHLVAWGILKGPISRELPPVELPHTFNMTVLSSRGITTLYEYSFGAVLDAGEKVKISINATSPINLQIRFSHNIPPEAGQIVKTGEETVIDKKAITSFDYELNVQKSGSYLFEFSGGTPEPIETKVTFDAYRSGLWDGCNFVHCGRYVIMGDEGNFRVGDWLELREGWIAYIDSHPKNVQGGRCTATAEKPPSAKWNAVRVPLDPARPNEFLQTRLTMAACGLVFECIPQAGTRPAGGGPTGQDRLACDNIPDGYSAGTWIWCEKPEPLESMKKYCSSP